jgi:hypothetical protein
MSKAAIGLSAMIISIPPNGQGTGSMLTMEAETFL